MRAVLFDMDGVLYNSDEPIPGAAETLAWLRRWQVPIYSSPTLPRVGAMI